jgi:hypothetical protein
MAGFKVGSAGRNKSLVSTLARRKERGGDTAESWVFYVATDCIVRKGKLRRIPGFPAIERSDRASVPSLFLASGGR